MQILALNIEWSALLAAGLILDLRQADGHQIPIASEEWHHGAGGLRAGLKAKRRLLPGLNGL